MRNLAAKLSDFHITPRADFKGFDAHLDNSTIHVRISSGRLLDISASNPTARTTVHVDACQKNWTKGQAWLKGYLENLGYRIEKLY